MIRLGVSGSLPLCVSLVKMDSLPTVYPSLTHPVTVPTALKAVKKMGTGTAENIQEEPKILRMAHSQ